MAIEGGKLLTIPFKLCNQKLTYFFTVFFFLVVEILKAGVDESSSNESRKYELVNHLCHWLREFKLVIFILRACHIVQRSMGV